MKKITFTLCLILTTLFISSCGENTTKELISNSSNNVNQLKVSGNRVMSVDPFKTSIIINGYEQSDTLMTEIYARNFTEENVKFNWSGNDQCTLTFIQQDDTERKLNIYFDANGNSLKEVN